MYGVFPTLMSAFMYRDHGGQKRVLESLELELQMVVDGHVGTRNLASGTAARGCNCRVISLAPEELFFNRGWGWPETLPLGRILLPTFVNRRRP